MMSQPEPCKHPKPMNAAWKARGWDLLTILGIADDRVAPLGETR